MSDTITFTLTQQEAEWLQDAIRWQLEALKKQGYGRGVNKLTRVQNKVEEQL